MSTLNKIIFFIFLISNISFAKEEASSNVSDYSMIYENNIFDPSRGSKKLLSKPEPSLPPKPVLKLEKITVTGSMVSNIGNSTYAQRLIFIEGSKPEYYTTMTLGMKIEGFELTKIETSQIELSKNDKIIKLPIGKSITGNEEKEWIVLDIPKQSVKKSLNRKSTDNIDKESTDNTDKESIESADRESADNTDDNLELLKKLMERRQEELSR